MNSTEDYRTLQNSSEPFRNLQNTSEDFNEASKRVGGIGRGKKYPGAEIPDSEFDRNDYIIMEEAYGLFEGQGERRSVRMIAEYCKTGELICLYDSDDKRWHISKESVENKIEKIKALNARRVQSEPQNTSQHTSEEFNTVKNSKDDTHKEQEVGVAHELENKVKELEKENMDLKITNRGKDYFIEQLQQERQQFRDDRDQFVKDLVGFSKRIGVLETQLKQIEAPREDRNLEKSITGGATYQKDETEIHPPQPQDFREPPTPEVLSRPPESYGPEQGEELLANKKNYEDNHKRISIHTDSEEPNHFSRNDDIPRQS